MFCRNCGKEIPEGSSFCGNCGARIDSGVDGQIAPVTVTGVNSHDSPKSRTVAALLCFFLGGLGIHRFYVGKSGTGILQILLSICLGLGCIWAFVDLIIILCGNFKDAEGRLVSEWNPKY